MNFFLLKIFLTPLLIFLIGLFGLFGTRRNMIVVLMSIELILLAGTIYFVFFSLYLDDLMGQIFAFIILVISASESSIGLALLVLHYRHKALISVDGISYLKN
jgi:NADH-quinone oxidoreductase subunit K